MNEANNSNLNTIIMLKQFTRTLNEYIQNISRKAIHYMFKRFKHSLYEFESGSFYIIFLNQSLPIKKLMIIQQVKTLYIK